MSYGLRSTPPASSASQAGTMSAADKAKMDDFDATAYATVAANANSALQSVPDASTSIKGLSKKSATLTSAAANILTNNSGGTASTTIAVGTTIGTVLSVAANVTDVASLATWAKNSIASLTTELNATRARLEDVIAKQQTAGQQT